MKRSRRENLEKKRELVALAESVKDSEDIKATIAILKKAQADWKKIGYVSKKEGDQVWADFRAACNHFFDKLKGERKAQEAAANAVVKAKNDLLGKLKKAKITSLDEAIEWTTQWGASGDAGKKNGALNNAFDEALADKAKGLGMDEMGLKSALFEAKVKALVEADDQHGLRREREWLRKNQDTAEKELHQLENNIAFFSGSNNPLLEAANARIAEQKAAVEQWQALRKSFNRLLK